jgi:hypothetical protein
VADVSTSAYCEWKQLEAAGPIDAVVEESYLIEEIRAVHAESDGYRSRLVTKEVRRRGYCVNHKRAERLMARTASLASRQTPSYAPPCRPSWRRARMTWSKGGLDVHGLGPGPRQPPPGQLDPGRPHAHRAHQLCP